MNHPNKIISFGEEVKGYNLPVLNEREIRAAAGILFLFMFISLMLILFEGNFLMIKYVIIVFLGDLLTRVFVNPKFSPTLIIGRLIVRRQMPEYVGAAQKKFAWKIGIAIAGIMFFLLVVVNSYSIITGLGCLICLSFLFFESAFGICLGCIVYNLVYKQKARYCAGEICQPHSKQEIQKISGVQILVLVGLVAFIIVLLLLFNDAFIVRPRNLWSIIQ
ncbi:MAG: DUF4395 domain-containing protein [Flavisolibacter sp.]|nr:DUF4395 domain-containing protein [Flavisolibacter sp.]